MSVYWAKVVVFAILVELYPEYNIVYVDSDAVITEDLFRRVMVRDEIQSPTILYASDLGGPHSAGFYMLFWHQHGTIEKQKKLPPCDECLGIVMTKWSNTKLTFTTSESHPLILNEVEDSFEKCIQSMMTCVRASTTLDRVKSETIDDFSCMA